MKGIVLHGGSGTRLRPLTHTGPKQLIPIANKPVSQYALEDLLACGIKEVAFVLGDIRPEKVKDCYGDGSHFGAEFTYLLQGEPRGIAHAISLCRGFVHDSPFVVYLGDNLIKGGIKKYAVEFEHTNADAMILLSRVKDPSRFGVARLDKNGQITGLEEKPKKPASDLALTGIYFLKPAIFGMIDRLKPSWRNELEITDALQLLLNEQRKIDYHIVEGWWKDTGTPEDILESNRLVLDDLTPRMQGIAEDPGSMQGRVAVGKGSRIGKGATLRGPCIIGEESVLEPGVYVGPYTSIGNNVSFRRGIIEDSIIMDNCTIDIPCRISSSIIGKHSVITGKAKDSSETLRMVLGENCQVSL